MIPHLRTPITFIDGRAKVADQDSTDEIIECCKNILRFPVGQRIDLPEFGAPDLLFAQLSPADGHEEALRSALEEWEPRAVAEVEREPGMMPALTEFMNIKISEDGRG